MRLYCIQNSRNVRTQISIPDLQITNSANNLNDTTNIMTFHFSLKPIAIELRTVIVCILCKLRMYSPPLHKNSWETRKWQVNLGQPGTFYHFSHAQTKRKHLTKRTNRLYPLKTLWDQRSPRSHESRTSEYMDGTLKLSNT